MVQDLKTQKRRKVKGNRLKKKAPRDWRRLFHRLLRAAVWSVSAVLVLSGSALAVRVLLDSDLLRIETVRVENLERVGREEVVALADVRPGLPILQLDLGSIGRKIEEHAWIARAEVERNFPREVVIRVREHSPRAIINLGYLYYVDEQGVVFKGLGSADRLDFPVITGIDRDQLLADDSEARARLKGAIELIAELESRRKFGLEDVSEIHCDPRRGYVIHTYISGIPVRVGRNGFGEKLDRLERVYKELEPRLPGLKYIDLTVARRVIVKMDIDRRSASRTDFPMAFGLALSKAES